MITSAIDNPVGLKNPINGSEIETKENSLSPSILRGYQNKRGWHIQNYSYSNLMNVIKNKGKKTQKYAYYN